MKMLIFLIFLQTVNSPSESNSADDTLNINLKGTNTIVFHKTEYKGIYFPYDYSYFSRNNFLHMNAEGSYKGYEIEGEIREPYSRFDEEIAYIGIKGENLEVKGGNTSFSFYGNPYLTSGFKGRGIYFKFNKNDFFTENIISFPQGEFIFERIYGNGTQGPYRLKNYPVLRGSERIRIIREGKTKELIRRRDYRIDYVLGEIWFEKIVYEDEIIEIEYQKKEEGKGMSGIRAGFNDKGIIKSLAVSILKMEGNKNTYGFDMNVSPFKSSNLSFIYAGNDLKENIWGIKGDYTSRKFKLKTGYEKQTDNYKIYGEAENFKRNNFFFETFLNPSENFGIFYRFKRIKDKTQKIKEHSEGANYKFKIFEIQGEYLKSDVFYHDSLSDYRIEKKGFSIKFIQNIFIGKFMQSIGIYEGENERAGISEGSWKEYVLSCETKNFSKIKGDFEIKILNQNKKYRNEGSLNINYFPFKSLTGSFKIEGRKDFEGIKSYTFKKGFYLNLKNLKDNLEIKREERIPYGWNQKSIFYIIRNNFNFKNKRGNLSYMKFYEISKGFSLINEDNIRFAFRFNKKFSLLSFYQLKNRKRKFNNYEDIFIFEGKRFELREDIKNNIRGLTGIIFKREKGEKKGISGYKREKNVRRLFQEIDFRKSEINLKTRGIFSDSLYRDTLFSRIISTGAEFSAKRKIKFFNVNAGFGIFSKRGVNEYLWKGEEKFLTLKPLFGMEINLKILNMNFSISEERSISKSIYAVRNLNFSLNLYISSLIFNFNFKNNEDLKIKSYKRDYTLTLGMKIQ